MKRLRLYLILLVSLTSCTKEFLNPYDSSTPSESWTPSEFQIERIASNKVLLTWSQSARHIDGFRITKYLQDTSYTFDVSGDSLNYTDTSVIPTNLLNSCFNVYYSITAYAAENESNSTQSEEIIAPLTSEAIAGEDISSANLVVNLSGSSPELGESGRWEVVSGQGGIFADSTTSNTTFTRVENVDYTLRWSIHGLCQTTEDYINLLFINLPTITTIDVSNVSSTTATCGGNVSSDGGSEIFSKGVCWSTNPTPTISGSRTNEGAGSGSFSSSLTGLQSSTTYYVRAYAENEVGLAYGNEQFFTTSLSGLPTITTSIATNISSTSIQTGGNVTSDGGQTVNGRGVCYSTVTNPTLSDNVITGGSGTGSFVSNITGLAQSTVYYVRAFATNNAGTTYGNQISFVTEGLAAPTLLSPIGGESVSCCNFTLQWTCVSGASSYELQISGGSNFSGTENELPEAGGANGGLIPSGFHQGVVNTNCSLGNEFSPLLSTGTSGSNGTYFWRVRADSGQWSDVASFIYQY